MRDDLPPRPAFRFSASDEALAGGPTPSEPAQAPVLSQTGRIVLIGAAMAAVLGAAIGLTSPKSFRGAPDTEPVKARAAASAAQLTFRPIGGRYRPPDRVRIAAAYQDAARLLSEEGVSGVARASMDCFEKLFRQPDYGLMDYCLALDAYGAQAYERAAGDAAPPSTYFGQAPVRRQRAVQELTAGHTDANSRVLDTNRLIQQVAVEANPPPTVVAPPPPAPIVAAEPAPAPVVVAERGEPESRPQPRPAPADPPARATVRDGPTPSFDCRFARTRGERMVCREPALAAADRRLAAAFDRAVAQSANPRALMADQNRWLALRDEIAPDYEGVMGLYQDRIAELRRQRY
jgi:hypothetical protein